MEDPDLSQIFTVFLKRETTRLTEIEHDRLDIIVANLFRSYDTAFSMQMYDLFGENEWARFQSAICGNYQLAVHAGHDETVHMLTTPDFMNYIWASC
jgi:hypothetical protein